MKDPLMISQTHPGSLKKLELYSYEMNKTSSQRYVLSSFLPKPEASRNDNAYDKNFQGTSRASESSV